MPAGVGESRCTHIPVFIDCRSTSGPESLAPPEESALRRACGRLLHVDDLERLDAYRSVLGRADPPEIDETSDRATRLLRMLVATVCDQRVAENARSDLLAFTLDKTQGQFSPTPRYRDYAINRELIHWESQSVVREASVTGQRYQNHSELGSSIMLFARETTNERAFWFLGPATYLRHEGERPMACTWRLEVPLPGDLFAAFAAAVA